MNNSLCNHKVRVRGLVTLGVPIKIFGLFSHDVGIDLGTPSNACLVPRSTLRQTRLACLTVPPSRRKGAYEGREEVLTSDF